MQEDFVSKTRRKKEMHALQALGAALVDLPESRLADVPLEPALYAAVIEAKRIKSHEARRRQLQYIGRLMREVDAEPIRAKLAEFEGNNAESTARHRRLETLRERLIDDDEALTEFAALHPGADLQQLRTLIRTVRKARDEGKPQKAYRELFRFIKECSD